MDHTLKAVDEELAALARDVAELGALAVSQLKDALRAFAQRDAELGREVAARDERLDALDAAVERNAIRFIALRQPMADDLRRPITAMKTAMNLERCGDLAKNIAKRVGKMAEAPGQAQAEAIADLGRLVAERLEAVMTAYAARDASGALEVWARDEEVDALHDRVFAEILACMSRDAGQARVCTHLMFIAKNLERIGDHATNVAEMVHYQITGHDLSGRPKL
ncbi:phosphate signaling complex protein PhoU [Phenylobacterium sp.]|jgi:phosphate transport system protein|uniref:phosphate signaling complex protein PhoU n=1 Tax=Phenylobacterium sp. TaxID=1871053 RepID=UPI002F93B639